MSSRLTSVVASGRRRGGWAARLVDRENADAVRSWPLWPAVLGLAATWALFAWPWLSGRVVIPWDAAAHFMPQVQFLAQSLARGESPFWLPYAFSGTLQIADPQSLIFSPPFLALALVDGNPTPETIGAAVFVALLLAGIGVLWLARELGWHWLAGLLGALAFMFGAAMAWRLQHFGQVLSLAYLPVTLLCLRRGLERGGWLWGGLAGVGAAFILLGRDQVGLLCLYVLAGYVVLHFATADERGPALRRAMAPLAAGAVAGLVLAGPPLVLTLLHAAQSNRPEIDFIGAGRGSLHPALMVTAAVPHLFGAAGEMALYWGPPSFTWVGTDLFIAQNMGQLYIGAVPFLLLATGAVRGVFGSRAILFFVLAFAGVTLYAVGWFTPAFRAFYEILPGVKMFRRPADAVFLMGGLGALLAAYAAHRWWTDDLPPLRPWQVVAALALVLLPFALGLGFAMWLDRVGLALKPLAIAAAWFAGAAIVLAIASWLRPIRPMTAAAVVVAFTAIDLTANNGPNGATALPPSELAMLDPNSANPTLALLKAKIKSASTDTERPRVELTGLGFHWPNASLPHRLENVVGYNPVRIGVYAAATGASDTVGLPDQRQFTPLFPGYDSALADLLGLRFIATGVPVEAIDRKITPGRLVLVARTADGFVYENPRALPRVLFATRAVGGDFARMIETGVWPVARGDLARIVVLEGVQAAAPARRPGDVRIVRWGHTAVTLEADSPDGGWVVLNDLHHPWWRATLDGQPVESLRANVLFRAVAVPPGRHRIEFALTPVAGALTQLRQTGFARVGIAAGGQP